MNRIVSNGYRFHYWQGGSGENVVMIHGLGANLMAWQFTLAADFVRHFRVTMYDLRGHGRSDIPPDGYSALDMAEDLHGILDALQLPRVHLVGHSFGADVALLLAYHHPERVRRLVAIEAGLPWLFASRQEPGWSGWDEWARLLDQETGIQRSPHEWYRIYDSLRRGNQPDIRSSAPKPTGGRKKSRVLELLGQTNMICDYEQGQGITRNQLACIHVPTLLVYGDSSSYRPAMDLLRDTLPESVALLEPKADHFSVLHAGLAPHVVRFLQVSDSPPLPPSILPMDGAHGETDRPHPANS